VDVYLLSGRRAFLISFLYLVLAALPPLVLAQSTPRGDNKEAGKSSASDNGAVLTPAKDSDNDPVYQPGKDVKPPKLVHYVEPQFSPSSKEAFVEGTVRISTVVTRDGIPTALKIISGLNAKEDETAMEALKQWRFAPGTKAGQPVKVRVTVEVDFHLL
jgi:TonB family protein